MFSKSIIFPTEEEISSYPVSHGTSLETPTSFIIDKEKALREKFPCIQCEDGFMSVDSESTRNYHLCYEAKKLHDMNTSSNRDIVIYRCEYCHYMEDSQRLAQKLTPIVSPDKDLRRVASRCNPKIGQPWVWEMKDVPTQMCELNNTPCYRELWKVCPHLKNHDYYDIINSKETPTIGELES